MTVPAIADARDALRAGDLDAALAAIIAATERLLAEGSPVWRLPIGWREADALCDEIGDRLAGTVAPRKSSSSRDLDLYIATQVYAGGGHTAVIGDFIRGAGAARSEVLLTGTVERDIHPGGRPQEEIIERLGIDDGALAVCPEAGRADSARWLIDQLRARRPSRVFLFHHPQDAVAVAGARASLCGELYLVHHADRQPCLGLFQRGITTVDLSPYTGEFTRRVLGLENTYAPLTIADPGSPPARELTPPFTTASSGAAHKFGNSYAENIARVLETTGGRHVHIGFLKEKRLDKIRAHLVGRGLGPERLEYIRWVPSLAKALIELKVALGIGSSPLGGARTAIESCAAGVPMLSHHPAFSTRFGAGHLVPDTWPLWNSTDQLIALLADVDAAWIADEGRRGREFYESHHHPEQLCKALADLAHSRLPVRADLPLSELLDVSTLSSSLTGEWAFLRSELGDVLP